MLISLFKRLYCLPGTPALLERMTQSIAALPVRRGDTRRLCDLDAYEHVLREAAASTRTRIS